MDTPIDALVGFRTASVATSPSASSTLSLPARPSDRQTTSSSSATGHKPKPLDLTHLYAETTKQRLPSKMKAYYKFFQIPNIGNLAGGLPNVQFFPYDTLEAKIAKPERWTPSPNKQAAAGCDDDDDDDDEDGAVLVADRVAAVNLTATSPPSSSPAATGVPSDRVAPEHLAVPKVAPIKATPDKKIDLATALQYGSAEGYPPLLAWIRRFTREHLHPNVPYEGGPDVVLTVGSTDGFNKTLELFVDDWNPNDDIRNRPGLLSEPFIYGNVLSQIAPKGMHVVTVDADADGMIAYGPGGLEDVLANWDYAKGRRPHLMYTVTMGHNPTGVLLSIERRRQLYEVCSRFDVIIAEDDPYWYLQYPSAAINEAASRHLPRPKAPIVPPTFDAAAGQRSSGYEYLDSLVPSFLSLDVDGRVVRLDTFSKTVAPGCRLGWITAQPALIERFTRISETGTQQPSGFVQSLVSELVMGPLPATPSATAATSGGAITTKRTWGKADKATPPPEFSGWQMDGWVRWLAGLRGEYERRMNRMCTILDDGAFQLKQGTPLRAADADWGVITKTRLYSFDWPRGGMFIWLRMHFEAHPLWMAPRAQPPSSGVGDAAHDSAASAVASSAVLDGAVFSLALMLFLTFKPHLVLVSPGSMFSGDNSVLQTRGWAYYRLCFAAESDENVDACSRRFVAGVQKFWKIKKAEDIEEILHSMDPAAAQAAAAGELGNLGTFMGC